MTVNAIDLSRLASRPESPRADAAKIPLPARRWKTRVLLPAVLLIGTAAVLIFAMRDALLPAVDVKVTPGVTRSGVASGGTTMVQAAGWIEPDPYAIAVSALAEGIVREVHVLEGMRIEKDQVVASLIDTDARLALDRTEAELAAAEAELRAAQMRWEHPIELDRDVASASALVAEKQAEVERLASEEAVEAAKTAELEAELERITDLRSANQTSEIEFIRLTRQVEAQRALRQTVQRRRPILEAQLRKMETDLAAARQRRELRIEDTQALAAARAMRDRAQVQRDEAELRLERMQVRAPVAGVVMARLVEPGAKLMLLSDMPQGAQVARLYDPQKLQVRVDVPQGEAGGIDIGQQVEVVANVAPDQVFRGLVTRVVPEADLQKNTLQVKVAIESPSAELKPEMLARARFLAPVTAAPAEEERVMAPLKLLHEVQGEAAQAFVVDVAAGVARLRSIRLGTGRQDGWVEVREGLRAGDRLISWSAGQVNDGTRVRVVGEDTGGLDGAD